MRKYRFIAVDTETPPKRCHRFGADPFDLVSVNGFQLPAPEDKYIREAGGIDILADCAMAPEPGGRHDLHVHFSLTAATSCNVIFHPMSVLGNDCACQRPVLSASCAVLCIAADSGFARHAHKRGQALCRGLPRSTSTLGRKPGTSTGAYDPAGRRADRRSLPRRRGLQHGDHTHGQGKETSAGHRLRTQRGPIAQRRASRERRRGFAQFKHFEVGSVIGSCISHLCRKFFKNNGLILWQPVGESNPSFQVENLAS